MEERELHDVLENGIGHEPPIVGGPDAVFAGARAKVVRTRMMTGALSVAAVLGVAAGAVAIGGGGTGHSGAAQSVAPAAGGSEKTSPTPATAAPQSEPSNGTVAAAPAKGGQKAVPAPVPGAGQVLLDGRTTADLLKQVLPAGLTTSHYFGQDSYLPQQSGVQTNGAMEIVDAHGSVGAIGLNVQQNMGMLLAEDCSGDCTVLPDGSHLTVRKMVGEKPTAAGAPQTVDWSVDRVFKDGHRVVVGVKNYFDDLTNPHEKGWTTTATGRDPLVSIDQLKSIVGDPRWTLTVAADVAAHARNDLPGYTDLSQDSSAVSSGTPKSTPGSTEAGSGTAKH